MSRKSLIFVIPNYKKSIFMAKIQKSKQIVTPFGGVFLTNEAFTQSGMSKLIDNELGKRFSIDYQYSDIFRSIFDIFLCGGDCMEDIQTHLRPTLENIPNNKVPSADTLLRGIKELATINTEIISSSGKSYNFNINEKMNDLNLKSLLLTGQLKAGGCYDLDYDNQILEHEKYDAKRTYKHNTGYFPGVASIGNIIAYIENRDGNANVKTAQKETLERMFKLFKKNDIDVDRARMDAGSYCKDVISLVEANCNLFYIRANKCDDLTARIREITDWKTVEINYKNYQVASLPFTQFLKELGLRLVVMREKNANGQTDLFTGDDFIYRCILTNDHQGTEKEIIEYYNQRGGAEKLFDIQNNDFGWNHLPCSDMNYNTVYLILTAMVKNFYNYLLGKISKIFKDISPVARLKQFIFRFIAVSGKWIRQGRQWKILLYTNKPYEKLKFT